MTIDTEKSPSPNFAALLDAAQDEPVFIERGDTDVAVILSAEQYNRLRRTAVKELLDICNRSAATAQANGLTEETFEDLMRDVR